MKYSGIILCLIFMFSYWIYELNKKQVSSKDSHWVAGSILKARESGIFHPNVFSANYKCNFHKDDAEYRKYNRKVYVSKGEIDCKGNWFYYKSALRWHETLYEAIDIGLWKITGKKRNLLYFFKLLGGFLGFLSLFYLYKWIALYFDKYIAVGSVLFLTNAKYVFASINLEWPTFLPFFMCLFFVSKWLKQEGTTRLNLKIFFASLFSILMFALKSYEWVPSLMVAVTIPIFFNIPFRNLKSTLVSFISSSIGSIIGLGLALVLHFLAVAQSFEWSFLNANNFLSQKFLHRTSGNSEISQIAKHDNLSNTSYFDVIKMYFTGDRIWLNFNPIELLSIVAICFLILAILSKVSKKVDYTKSLLLGFGISLLSVIVFFIIFKAHATAHFNVKIDYYVFSFSFVVLSLLTIMLTIRSLFQTLGQKLNFSNRTINVLFMMIPIALFIYRGVNKNLNMDALKFSFSRNELFRFTKNENINFKINEKTTLIQDGVLYGVTNDPMMYIDIGKDQNVNGEIILMVDMESDIRDKLQLYYTTCENKNYVRDNSLRQVLQLGRRKYYFKFNLDGCSSEIRFDPISKAKSVKIHDLIIKAI